MKRRSDFTDREWQRILRSANKFAEYLANRLEEQVGGNDAETVGFPAENTYRLSSLHLDFKPQLEHEITLSRKRRNKNKRSGMT